MTLQELLECDAEILEKMTDDELLKHFQQYLVVTRPELAKVRKVTETKSTPAIYISPAKQAALAKLREEGLDLDFLLKRKKR